MADDTVGTPEEGSAHDIAAVLMEAYERKESWYDMAVTLLAARAEPTAEIDDKSDMPGVALLEMRSMLVTVKLDRRGRQHGVAITRIGEMMEKHLANVRTEFDRHGTPRVALIFEGVDLRFEQVEVYSEP